MQLNQTLEATTFWIPDQVDPNIPYLCKAFENQQEFLQVAPQILFPKARAQKLQFPSPIQQLLSLTKQKITPKAQSPFLITSLGSNYAYAVRNSPIIEVRVNSEQNPRQLIIDLQKFTRIFKNQGFQAICFASSSVLVATSFDEIYVFTLYISRTNRLSIANAYQIKNGDSKILKEQATQYQKCWSAKYYTQINIPDYDLICASQDGKYCFISQLNSQSVKMVSIPQQVVAKEYTFLDKIQQIDCNQQGSLLAIAGKSQIILFDTISGRKSYITNTKPECLTFYKATLFKPENCIPPDVTQLSQDNILTTEAQQRHQSTLMQTMQSLQLQTNHRSLDYQMPEYEFLAFCNKNDVTCFIYSIQRQQQISATPAVCFDFSKHQGFGGRIDNISWCDGVLAVKCEDNVVLCATREESDSVSGIVNGGIMNIGSEKGNICIGRTLVIGCSVGVVCFGTVE